MSERELQSRDSRMSRATTVKFKRIGKSQDITIVPGTQKVNDLDLMKAYIISADKLIQFVPSIVGQNEYTASIGDTVTLELGVTNGIGVIDVFNSTTTVKVVIKSGSGEIVGSDTIEFDEGEGIAKIKSTSAGEVVIGLTAGNTDLDRSDTAKITFS